MTLKKYTPTEKELEKLAKLMNLSPTELKKYEKLIEESNRYFDDLINKPMDLVSFEVPNNEFKRDIYFDYKMNFGPLIVTPSYVMLTPSVEELNVEILDLLYEIEEKPMAIERMISEGCRNCADHQEA